MEADKILVSIWIAGVYVTYSICTCVKSHLGIYYSFIR